MTRDLQAWLNQVKEDPIEADMPICDPHHHLWDRPDGRYMAEELLADTAGYNIVSTVFVECMSAYRSDGPGEMKPVGETDFVEALADANTRDRNGRTEVCAGIVSFADLSLGAAVKPVLEAHRVASPGRFRGIRHVSAWDASGQIRKSHTNPPDGLLLDAKFREGFACLAPLGLTFDAWLYHHQIGDLVDLASVFPETMIVLDHFGGPLGIGPYAGKPDEVFGVWKKAIPDLAACSNVVVKIGGLAMPRNGFEWHKRDRPPDSTELAKATERYYLTTIEHFGPDRCMFESNFPVDKLSCSYTVLWNSFKRMAEGFTPEEKRKLFHDTAARVYRIS